MAGKKGKKPQAKKPAAEKTEKKGKPQKKSSGGKGKKSDGKSKSRFQVDIFTEHCMENAYYICHNVQDVLKCRGFPWPYLQNKKKKGKKGRCMYLLLLSEWDLQEYKAELCSDKNIGITSPQLEDQYHKIFENTIKKKFQMMIHADEKEIPTREI